MLHHLNLVRLRNRDPHGELLHVTIGRPRLEQLGHLDRLRVVGDHALHEGDVRRGEARAWQRRCALGREHFRRLSRGAGLDDGRGRAAACAMAGRSGGQREQHAKSATKTGGHHPLGYTAGGRRVPRLHHRHGTSCVDRSGTSSNSRRTAARFAAAFSSLKSIGDGRLSGSKVACRTGAPDPAGTLK